MSDEMEENSLKVASQCALIDLSLTDCVHICLFMFWLNNLLDREACRSYVGETS